MESQLTNAYKIKLENLNFEGPFDLLFHLIEKNRLNIYDIPINYITDQYMEYLFAMQQFDLEIASEFLVMAATLLHIKSRMLLPERNDTSNDVLDPREELVEKLLEYKKYKEFADDLRSREKDWEKVYYKLPEIQDFVADEEQLELSFSVLRNLYSVLLEKNAKKMNPGVRKMAQIIEHEKVSLKNKMKEILKLLLNKPFFRFSDLFSPLRKPKIEVVTGFMAILELTKLKKAKLIQKKPFTEIMVYKNLIQEGGPDFYSENNEELQGGGE